MEKTTIALSRVERSLARAIVAELALVAIC